MYDIISSPVDYGGLTLKNRIIFAPTTLGLSEEEQVAKLETIAAGGCAMIILGDVPVGTHGFGPDLFSKKAQPTTSGSSTPLTATAAWSAPSSTSPTPISWPF